MTGTILKSQLCLFVSLIVTSGEGQDAMLQLDPMEALRGCMRVGC